MVSIVQKERHFPQPTYQVLERKSRLKCISYTQMPTYPGLGEKVQAEI
jgi:hypothetical protein